MHKSTPKVFISYSHDSAEHKRWTLDLATRLVHAGIDANIDAWSLKPGDDIPHFMETQLTIADRVLMICTDNYIVKANKGAGGVGYEKMIVTASMMKNIDDNKVIPIIRQNGSTETPTFLKSKLYLDFSNDAEFESVIDDLIRAIHGEPLYKKPAIGSNPLTTAQEKPAEPNNDLKREILKLCVNIYEAGKDGFKCEYYYKTLGISRVVFDILVNELESERLVRNVVGNIYITDKAKVYAIQQGWV